MSKKKLIICAAAVLSAAGIVLFLTGRKEEQAEYELRPTVVAEQPQKGSIVLYTDLTGTVEPHAKATVIPKISGEVLTVNVQAGDRVEPGQILCTIDSDALTTLKLQMESASVAYNEAQRELERNQPLYAGGFISQQVYDQIRDQTESARLAYESAKNQYDLQMEYTTVTAPIGGTVESCSVEPHDHVNTANGICVISGGDQMEVSFGVTEKTRRNMNIGDEVDVSKNGLAYKANVSEIESMVNGTTGLYDAKAVLSESEGLMTGTKVKVTVVMDRAEDTMTIPLSAVSYDNGQAFVYVYDNGTAKKAEIESGIYDSERMQVLSGLTEEDQVISDWSNELVDGAEVLLESQPEETQEAGE